MRTRSTIAALGLTAGLLASSLVGNAIGAEIPFAGNRVTVESSRSFEDVSKALTSLVATNGMMVMAEVDQGSMLSMAGLKLKARLYIVGNPTVGKQLFEQDHAVGLYVPLRVFVYADADDRTFIEYDKPSALLGQFRDEKITEVAEMLDQKLEGLASMASR